MTLEAGVADSGRTGDLHGAGEGGLGGRAPWVSEVWQRGDDWALTSVGLVEAWLPVKG